MTDRGRSARHAGLLIRGRHPRRRAHRALGLLLLRGLLGLHLLHRLMDLEYGVGDRHFLLAQLHRDLGEDRRHVRVRGHLREPTEERVVEVFLGHSVELGLGVFDCRVAFHRRPLGNEARPDELTKFDHEPLGIHTSVGVPDEVLVRVEKLFGFIVDLPCGRGDVDGLRGRKVRLVDRDRDLVLLLECDREDLLHLLEGEVEHGREDLIAALAGANVRGGLATEFGGDSGVDADTAFQAVHDRGREDGRFGLDRLQLASGDVAGNAVERVGVRDDLRTVAGRVVDEPFFGPDRPLHPDRFQGHHLAEGLPHADRAVETAARMVEADPTSEYGGAFADPVRGAFQLDVDLDAVQVIRERRGVALDPVADDAQHEVVLVLVLQDREDAVLDLGAELGHLRRVAAAEPRVRLRVHEDHVFGHHVAHVHLRCERGERVADLPGGALLIEVGADHHRGTGVIDHVPRPFPHLDLHAVPVPPGQVHEPAFASALVLERHSRLGGRVVEVGHRGRDAHRLLLARGEQEVRDEGLLVAVEFGEREGDVAVVGGAHFQRRLVHRVESRLAIEVEGVDFLGATSH